MYIFVSFWFQWPFITTTFCQAILVCFVIMKFLWILLGPLRCGKDLSCRVVACMDSRFAKALGTLMSPGGETGPGSWGVVNLPLCCPPILGSLNSPPFSSPLCILLIFRFYSCHWWEWADINFSELELDFNDIVWVSFLEGNPGGSSFCWQKEN